MLNNIKMGNRTILLYYVTYKYRKRFKESALLHR